MPNEKRGLRIGIVGGGIGGVITAITLGRDGHEVSVFDQRPNLEEIGAGIQITPNASRLLVRLGFLEKMDAFSSRMAFQDFRRWDGTIIARYGLNPLSDKRWGAPRYGMHRADLHNMLLAELPPSTVRMNMRCRGTNETSDGIVAEFEDGSKHTFDAVIGADGINSVIRKQIVNDPKIFSGTHIARSVIPTEKLPRYFHGPPKLSLWMGPRVMNAIYPVWSGRAYCYVLSVPADSERPESWVAKGKKEEIIHTMKGWHNDAFATVDASEWVLILTLRDRAPLEKWSEGRFTLLGDAAHPMFPYRAQGASMAVEDAWVLAKCLRGKTRDEVVESLKLYEKTRIRRCSVMQIESHKSGMLDDKNPQNTSKLFLSDREAAETKRDDAYKDPKDTSRDDVWGYDAEIDGPWDPTAMAEPDPPLMTDVPPSKVDEIS